VMLIKAINRGFNVCIEKLNNGAWRVSDIVGGYRVERVFFGYTKRQARALFAEYVSNLEG